MVDERKKIFIETVENLFSSYPLAVPSEALEFFEDYKKCSSTAKEMTEKGYNILKELKEVNVSGRQTKLLNLQLRDLGLVIYQPKYFIICIMYLHLY